MQALFAQRVQQSSQQVEDEVSDRSPTAIQRLLYGARWDEDAVRDELQRFITEQYGDEDGIVVIGETSFQKRGRKSIGVHHQYSRSTGKVENCQIGVFLIYTGRKGCAFIDRRLYLPEAWSMDRVRRSMAKVPDDVKYCTRPDLAFDMLQQTVGLGMPIRWITGDEAYGDDADFRTALSASGCIYVLGISSDTLVSSNQILDTRSDTPTQREGDLLGSRPTISTKEAAPRTVADVVAGWSEQKWNRLILKDCKGNPRLGDWAQARVVDIDIGLTGKEVWLLACRSVSQRSKTVYFLSNADPNTSLEELARVASSCGLFNLMIEEARSEIGFDKYKVRYWHSWYRHITLSIIAHTWLYWIQQQQGLEARSVGSQRD